MVEKQVDILIIGGGLTGATLMLALQGWGFSTLLVESLPFSEKVKPDFDARSLALAPASRHILQGLGIWEPLKEYATPIQKIHVSSQGGFGVSLLEGKESNPLGHVVEMQAIHQVLHRYLPKNEVLSPATVTTLNLETKTVRVATKLGEVTITAKLLVAADGTESTIRQLGGLPAKSKSYNQQAIVANVGLMKAHQQTAYERFTAQGPLALLPLQQDRMALVWAMDPKKADHMMQLPPTDFLQQLQQAVGYRLGRLVKIGKRVAYPLKQVQMPQQTQGFLVFVGNAAHTLHPVAGQGFNLGLRDVATLAQCIQEKGLDEAMLTYYLQLRRHDQEVVTRFTEGLIQVFTSSFPGMGLLRSLALVAFDNLPFLKNELVRYAGGFGGFSPDLVCGLAPSKPKGEAG